MNKSFQSYTPIARPMNYDSLKGHEGCEADSGNDFYDALAFSRICVFEHDETNQFFAQPANFSYALGPLISGTSTKPFVTGWGMWTAAAGLRYGKFAKLPSSPSSAGSVSPIYGVLTPAPASVTHAFNEDGYLAVAIQKTPTGIELKRIIDDVGTISTVATFLGQSPSLFYTGLLSQGSPTAAGLVLYYLRPEQPNVIFGRFEADAFLIEREVMPDLRTQPDRIVSSRITGRKHIMRIIDDLGRDVTLSTADYAAKGEDAGRVDVAFEDGLAYEVAVSPEEQTDDAVLVLGFVSGAAFDMISEAATIPIDKAEVEVGFISGDCIAGDVSGDDGSTADEYTE